MPENPGREPEASHGEAGTAGEQVHVVRRTADEHAQETSNEETGE